MSDGAFPSVPPLFGQPVPEIWLHTVWETGVIGDSMRARLDVLEPYAGAAEIARFVMGFKTWAEFERLGFWKGGKAWRLVVGTDGFPMVGRATVYVKHMREGHVAACVGHAPASDAVVEAVAAFADTTENAGARARLLLE